ncbi:hypothetical protein PVAND_015423 [Polypedilum vanderplanki]|uniref:Uncharacterized protein n=1 Tax=Polypedilum vanderplanki TaxID=319348 RepID=A0A9J6BD29_POLVA|nr:hypothetical protein PVAND_015423 [Polypedilum vanderplanki]
MASTENEDDVCLPLPDILSKLEKQFNDDKTLNMQLVTTLFSELKKYQNGNDAIQEFRWLFGLGEEEIHMVDSKECRKVFLINFKTCARYLQTFLLNAVKFE